MCEWGSWRSIKVKVSSAASYTGKSRWALKPIDACIADLVGALQKDGIDMRGSCCGHGKRTGFIALQDGRLLELKKCIEGPDASCT